MATNGDTTVAADASGQTKNSMDDSSVVDRWFIPLPEVNVSYQLGDERVPMGTYTLHCKDNTGTEFLLSLKNEEHIDQVPIKCIPEKCKFVLGNCADVEFNNLSHLMMNLVKGRLKISTANGVELVYKNYLRNPIPAQTWFLAGKYDTDESIKFLESFPLNNRFAVWLGNDGGFTLGIKNNEVTTVPIVSQKRGFTVDGQTYFSQIEMLVNHYTKVPLPEREAESSRTLPRPLEVTFFHASMIYQRIEELLKPCPHLGQGKDVFHQEFAEMETKSKRNSFGFSDAQREKAIVKNRYKNILAFDHTRVKLKDCDVDYINANFVNADFQQFPPAYILCQAPMDSTIDDHWKMIVQEKVRIIIILTNVEEKGVKKCAKYWPDGDQVYMAGGCYSITVESEETVRDIIHKRLLVKNMNDDSEHRVYLMQYIAWPDFGVPKNSWGILELLIHLNKERDIGEPAPTIVHCSAGVGRTGAFVLLDVLLNKIRQGGLSTVIDVKEAIVEVRTQRALLVSTVDQYKFIHVTLLKYVQWKMGQNSFQI